MALEIALDAISVLRSSYALETFTFSSAFGDSLDITRLSLDEAKIQAIAKNILEAEQKNVSRRWPCPACGGVGPRVGKAPMISNFYHMADCISTWSVS